MSIRGKILFFFIILTLLLLTLSGILWMIIENARVLTGLEVRKYQSYKLAEELRRSSDDLTRMARTYTVTGDPRFRKYFELVKDIRDGKVKRPENYSNIFWDFVTANHELPKEKGREISIIDLMKELQFSREELNLLAEAKKRSDDLINLEFQAFNAMEGKFMDDHGKYSIRGKPDQEMAMGIVHGTKYHRAKGRIMEKINEFFILLESRTQKEVDEKENIQKYFFILEIVLSLVLISFSIGGYFFFKKDISKPLQGIIGWVQQMENGVYKFDVKFSKKDEIGILADSFINMSNKVQDQIHSLEYTSKTDPLTKINNRIALDNALIKEKYNFDRYSIACSIIILDLNKFKQINDKFGHLIGDKVLSDIASILVKSTRASDITGRWGGDEFLIICPNTSAKSCRQLAEHIKEKIKKHKFPRVGQITGSTGVSTFKKNTTIENVVNEADMALYKSKRT